MVWEAPLYAVNPFTAKANIKLEFDLDCSGPIRHTTAAAFLYDYKDAQNQTVSF